jgi:predicted RNA-binding protein YlxR (DUF448 family)
VVLREDGSLAVGRSLPGRGAWLCRGSPGCFERAVKRRAFGRALRAEVAAGRLEQLKIDLEAGGIPSPGSGGSVP